MFDAKVEKDKIIKFIQDYYKNNNLGGVVIGISGGKDSAVVSGLFTEALGKENVLGVTLPCHSNEEDRNDAKLVADHFGFKLLNVDLTEVNDVFKDEINKLGNFTEDELKDITELITDTMENIYKLSVPLKVEIDTGTNWYEAK